MLASRNAKHYINNKSKKSIIYFLSENKKLSRRFTPTNFLLKYFFLEKYFNKKLIFSLLK